jgi:hypothetical protein
MKGQTSSDLAPMAFARAGNLSRIKTIRIRSERCEAGTRNSMYSAPKTQAGKPFRQLVCRGPRSRPARLEPFPADAGFHGRSSLNLFAARA